jgi:hypothetical protein
VGYREYRRRQRLTELRRGLEGQREVGADGAIGQRDGAAIEALEAVLRRGRDGSHGGIHRRDGEQRARWGERLRRPWRLEVRGVRGRE